MMILKYGNLQLKFLILLYLIEPSIFFLLFSGFAFSLIQVRNMK